MIPYPKSFATFRAVLSPGRRLPQHSWSNNVVGALSPWLNLDSSNARVRTDSEKALKQEVMWAQVTLNPKP